MSGKQNNSVDQAKKKPQLSKAERRAIQEAQRAAKATRKTEPGTSKTTNKTNDHINESVKTSNDKSIQPSTSNRKEEKSKHKSDEVEYIRAAIKRVTFAPSTGEEEFSSQNASPAVHPAFIKLGVQCAEKVVYGVDAQCIALIDALKQFIIDYERPSDKSFGRDIESQLKPQMSFLTSGIPLPPALGNLIKQLKHHMTSLPETATEQEAKSQLIEFLDDFVQQKIELALRTVSEFTREKLKNSPVVLTYSWCPIVQKVLLDARNEKIDFRVFIIDSLPEQSGKKLLRNLLDVGIDCSYGLINSLAYVIKECSLVLLGADAVLANGNILGPLGCSQVALVAKSYNVPVLVPCSTYKFTEKVHTGSLDHEGGILNQQAQEVTPANLITALVTELRMLPPSSAPAVLRVKQVL